MHFPIMGTRISTCIGQEPNRPLRNPQTTNAATATIAPTIKR
jgi:hypothetical protein